MVFESPPDALGVIDDTWFGHVIDFGRPGPDRGEGGRFLLVPPGYDGPLYAEICPRSFSASTSATPGPTGYWCWVAAS